MLTSELDWDDTMHSEVGCSTDTSSNATPDSDESETNSVQRDNKEDLLNVQHVSIGALCGSDFKLVSQISEHLTVALCSNCYERICMFHSKLFLSDSSFIWLS